MDNSLAYLTNLLEDEFRGYPEVRIRVAVKAGIERSPDLVQDYNPKNQDLHLRSGVYVKTRRKEFYFPVEWTSSQEYDKIRTQIEEVLEHVRHDEG